MAVDTTEKKLSLLQFGKPFVVTLPVGDGTIDQGDRQHLISLYSGILAQEVVLAVPGLEFTAPENRMHFEAVTNRFHFTAPVNRLHFEVPEED